MKQYENPELFFIAYKFLRRNSFKKLIKERKKMALKYKKRALIKNSFFTSTIF